MFLVEGEEGAILSETIANEQDLDVREWGGPVCVGYLG